MKIVLADDHPIVRQGLRALLEAETDFQVIGEAGDGLEAVALVERVEPDVLVLDLMMPGLAGLEVARQTRQHSPQTRVVILSMHADESYVLEALTAGASAYVLKRSTTGDLVKAIRDAIAGRRFLSPPLSDRLIDTYVEKAKGEPLDSYNTLTTREREVLQLVAEGHTNVAIATRLFISPRTVEMHRASLMHKLGLQNQVELVRYALQRGILAKE
ncbi:MAG: response regulator transcription factor [Chloroflexi bacterium]|nr:response regulator transcription factor [Chloroflexota bacterium]